MDGLLQPTIKPHRKTRSGCKLCKERKIKCDERKPVCSHCIKRSARCEYLLQIRPNAIDNPQAHSSHSRDVSDSPHSFVTIQTPQVTPSQSNSQLPSLNMIDMELLHHYSTSTCFTMSTNHMQKDLWRISVPQLGFTYHFVLRGILAISALHIAHFRPERKERFVSQALLHHQAALPEATALLSNITQENGPALYLFSTLTLVFSLASAKIVDDFILVGESGVAEWLFLMKGTQTIVDAVMETLESSNLGPMFSAGKRRHHLRTIDSEEEDHLQALQIALKDTIDDPHIAQLYDFTVDELRKSYAVVYNNQSQICDITDVFIWPFTVPSQYLTLLRQRAQESLAIFGYFCVLLQKLESQWWLQGWSSHLISQIYSILDEDHRLWIRWPIEQIGWVPN